MVVPRKCRTYLSDKIPSNWRSLWPEFAYSWDNFSKRRQLKRRYSLFLCGNDEEEAFAKSPSRSLLVLNTVLLFLVAVVLFFAEDNPLPINSFACN